MRKRKGQIQPVNFSTYEEIRENKDGQRDLCVEQNDRTVKESGESGIRSREPYVKEITFQGDRPTVVVVVDRMI